MKYVLKKTSIALIALGISAGALANGGTVPMPASGFNVTVPHQDAGWAVGIEGMYWQPNMHNLAYAVAPTATFSGDVIDINTDIHTVEPDYDWGFALWGTYHFAGQGNDITLRWTRLHTDDDDSVEHPFDIEAGQFGVFPTKDHPAFGIGIPFEKGHSDVDFEYDAVDLMVGQHIDIGPCLDVRIAAGLRYVSLDTTVKDDFEFVIEDEGAIKEHVNYESDYQGIGPRVEIDGMYDFGSGFGFVAGAGASILIGENDVTAAKEIHSFDGDGDLEDTFKVKGDKGDTQQVVPEIDAKLGVNYVYNMGGQSSVAIEAGWKAVNYFDVHQRSRPVGDFSPATLIETAANVSMQGPYVNLEYRSA